MATVGEANVIVRPIVADFRQSVAQQVNRQLGTTGTKGVPLPITPTISPSAKAAFSKDVGGLRGILLSLNNSIASRALGIGPAAAGLFAFGLAAKAAVSGAANLEQQLNVFQQVSGATAEQMARVREEARRLGADIQLPAVSAGDAATTMTELAKAGLNVDQVLKGTKGTLQLASAAQLDFATASELSANALNAFSLSGSDATKVADLLAGAANAAQGNIADFGVGLSQVAAVAHEAGLSVQETVTFLTEFAKAGIAGSDAGTSFRVALLRLIAPTTEAQKIFAALGVNLNDFQSGRIRAPQFFTELQAALAPLDKATRNAALATIFGTDAIRVASIAVRDAGGGYITLAGQVQRSGQAQEIAAAQTSGLKGQVNALQSNIQTLGTDLGSFTLGPLTAFTKGLNFSVGAVDKLIKKLDDLSHRDLGPFGSIGDAIKKGFKSAVPELTDVERAANAAQKALHDATVFEFAPPKVPGAGTDAFGLHAFVKNSLADPQLARAMAEAGAKAGKAFTAAAGTEITKQEQTVINAAKKTVRDAQTALQQVIVEGNKAVASVVKEGAQAVADSAVSAKQNLTAIGSALSQQVIDILDSGPLAQRIKALQESLTKSQQALQTETLRRSLRDANEALARAEAQIAGGGPKSAAQAAGEREFLRPFKESVADAKSALEEFNTQGNIDRLTARLAAQKAQIQKTLDGLIAKFNAGLLSGTTVNARVTALLEKNVGPMAKAGKAQGFAFKTAFAVEVAALQAQIAAILGGPQTKKTGAEVAIVRPGDVAAQAAKNTADAITNAAKNTAAAQRGVKEALGNLHKTEKDAVAAVTGAGGTNDLLKQILAQEKLISGATPKKPSGDVKVPPKPTAKTGKR